MLTPVILSGGAGTRLWPLSNKKEPKQFLSLVSQNSLIQETLLRVQQCDAMAHPMVVNSKTHYELLVQQLKEMRCDPQAIILEPLPRNTAPAIAIAAMLAVRDGEDPILIVLPADHVIKNQAAFCEAVKTAKQEAQQGKLVTFGIVPHEPATGYGYIKRGGATSSAAFHVAQFVEKPDLKTAQGYLDSGEYYWNSGMFVFKASVFLDELKKHDAAIYAACEKAFHTMERDDKTYALNEEDFAASPKQSVDYAVMEKTDQAVVVPMDAGWSDIGSWSALLESCPHDNKGNVLIGNCFVRDVEGSYLRSETKKIVGIGLKNVVVVETDDAILVADKDSSETLKQVLAELEE